MGVRTGVFRGAAAIGAGKVLGQGASFLRSIIIARLLGVENYGLAALLAMTVALFTMITELATSRLIVQAPDGDDERLQCTIHLFACLQGLVGAIFIAALASPIARLFEAPEATWAFRALALIPLLTGLRHEDMSRYQRTMYFRPWVTVEVTSQIAATVAAFPLAWLLHDFSAVLWVLFVQQLTLVIMSHLVAERPYRWALDRGQAARILSFGWPLLINGLLMFGIFWGDRAIVGALYSKTELGVYSVASQLTMVLAFAVVGVIGSVSLPTLANVQDDPLVLERRYEVLAQCLSLIGALLVIPFAFAGGWVIASIYGPDYAQAGAFVGWLAAAQAMRLVRVAPTIAAIARADTLNSLFASLARFISIPAALFAASHGASLAVIASCGFVGEILAIGVATNRFWRLQGVRKMRTFGPGMLVVAAGAASWGVAQTGAALSHPAIILLVMVSLAAMVALVSYVAFRNLRGEWHTLMHEVARRLPGKST